MGRFLLACRAFWKALTSATAAERIAQALAAPALPKIDVEASRQQPPAAHPIGPAARSEAVTLLAALQREGRLVDLVKQPLAGFSDEQIGAAARNVLGDCAVVLDRFFGLQPVVADEEGTACEVPAGADGAVYKLTGRVEGSGPFRGTLVHHGWKVSSVNLPQWTGSKNAALVIAPAEVEI